MKTDSVFLLGLGVLALTLSQRGVAASGVPHLEMDLTGREYYQLLQNRERLDGDTKGPFTPILAMGKRFYDWLDLINKNRDAAHKISLSSAATQVAYPVEGPKRSNPTIIQTNFTNLKASLPAWLAGPLLNGGQLSADITVSDDEFADWGRKVTFVYEAASRWSLQEPYMAQYQARKVDDIRGYYFLSRETDLATKLAGWSGLDSQQKKDFSDWLVGQCVNSGRGESSCRSELSNAVAKGDATPFYSRYLRSAKDKYDSFFNITQYRNDVSWNGTSPNEFRMPFREPADAAIRQFLVDNIEDEWKFGGWQLRLAFSSSALANVTFVPGATPHVEDLAGDTITMDGNSPLSEYNVQWTIRHEFGHVIGFPDCYHEFYDSNEGVMISYQIDITNLMCSRRGHLQQRHVDELRRVYYQE